MPKREKHYKSFPRNGPLKMKKRKQVILKDSKVMLSMFKVCKVKYCRKNLEHEVYAILCIHTFQMKII